MKKILSKSLSCILIFALMVGAVACNPSGNPYGNPSGYEKKLIMGLDASFPPMGFTDEKNEIIGVDLDIAEAVCKKIGYTLVPKPISWDSKDMEINNGNIDCIWNGFTVTEEREKNHTLSFSYMENEQVIVVNDGSGIKNKADLKGKVVAAQNDSSGLHALVKDEIIDDIKDGKPKQYADYVTALGDLRVGRCDAIVMDSVVANYYIKANDESMIILDEYISKEEYAIGFKLGNDKLKEKVEKAMRELEKEGKLAEISEKWFGKSDMIKIID